MQTEARLNTPKLLPHRAPSQARLAGAFPELALRQLFGFVLIGGAAWLVVISAGAVGRWIGVGCVGVLLLISLALAVKQRTVDSLAILVYLATLQPALRTYVDPLPYLTLEYYFLLWVALALAKNKPRLRAPAIFYGLYLVLEVGGVIAAQNMERARSILIPSLTVGAALVLAGHLGLNKAHMRRLFTACLAGVATLAVIIGYSYSTRTIYWNTESNFATSGDMGPVQISMLLALGVVVLLLLADRTSLNQYRLVYLVLATCIGLAMLLTFSRSGLYLSTIAIIVYFVMFGRISVRTIAVVVIFGAIGLFLFQAASQIAGPAFVARYSDFEPSNRDRLIRYGWEIFLANPLLGEGTGNYSTVVAQAEYFGSISGAHNELIRAAAEHGIFGLVTWVLFACTGTWLAFSQKSEKVRALRMALLAVFFAYLFVNGLKLLIQPLTLLMALTVDEF